MVEVIAGTEAGIAIAETVASIIHTIQKVRRLKGECEELGKLVKLLEDILKQDKLALQIFQTETRVKKCLEEVKNFVEHCTQRSNLAGRAWEVMWDKKLPKLMAHLREMVLWLLLEAAVGGTMLAKTRARS